MYRKVTEVANIQTLTPNSLVDFIRVVTNNNFGDGKLLLELNKIVVEKQRMFNVTDMCMMLSGLAEIDRVTDSSLQMFTAYF